MLMLKKVGWLSHFSIQLKQGKVVRPLQRLVGYTDSVYQRQQRAQKPGNLRHRFRWRSVKCELLARDSLLPSNQLDLLLQRRSAKDVDADNKPDLVKLLLAFNRMPCGVEAQY